VVDEPARLPRQATPPWLWLWLALYLYYLQAEFEWWVGGISGLLFGSSDLTDATLARAVNVAFLLPHLIVVAGLLTILAPWARAAYLERKFRLTDTPPPLEALREIVGFVHEYAPHLEIKSNLLRTDHTAFVYPLGFKKTALAIFGGLIKLWRKDRRAAEAVLLHEIAHYRHGDALIVGVGSPFTAFLRFGLLVSYCSLLAGFYALLWALRPEGGIFSEPRYLALLASFPLINAAVLAVIVFPVFVVPLVGIWTTELNADRFAVETQGSTDITMRALGELTHRGSRWRWLLFRLAHPPIRMRRWMVVRSGTLWGTLLLLSIFPASDFLRASFGVVFDTYLFSSPEYFREAIGRNLEKWAVGCVVMAGLASTWPYVVRYWERLFTGAQSPGRPYAALQTAVYLWIGALLVAMAVVYYGAAPRSAVPDAGFLPDSRYSTGVFTPRLSLEASDSWKIAAPGESSSVFPIEREDGQMTFYNVSDNYVSLYNPAGKNQLNIKFTTPSPNDVTRWYFYFTQHPNLYVDNFGTAKVGGELAMRFDTGLDSAPEYSPPECEARCVTIFRYGSTEKHWKFLYEGWKYRQLILGVNGEMVMIEIAAPQEYFEEFLHKAQDVLNTIEWENSND
jgi:Zn-dependent protease with chaperone function